MVGRKAPTIEVGEYRRGKNRKNYARPALSSHHNESAKGEKRGVVAKIGYGILHVIFEDLWENLRLCEKKRLEKTKISQKKSEKRMFRKVKIFWQAFKESF